MVMVVNPEPIKRDLYVLSIPRASPVAALPDTEDGFLRHQVVMRFVTTN